MKFIVFVIEAGAVLLALFVLMKYIVYPIMIIQSKKPRPPKVRTTAGISTEVEVVKMETELDLVTFNREKAIKEHLEEVSKKETK